MRVILVGVPLVVLAVFAACAPPSFGEYPDSEDKASLDPPGETKSPSTSPTGVAFDGGLRPKGKPLVAVTITGPGSVTSAPAGLTCTAAQCSGAFDLGAKVTFTPVPAAGAIFVGWSGQCTGAGPCSPAISGDVAIGAEFQTLDGTWTGTYTHSQQSGGCTFNNAGDITVTASAANATSLATTTRVNGLEIRSGCALVDKREGTAQSNVAVANDTLTGTWKFAIPGIGGTLDLPFTAKLAGKTITGTWTCSGCTGSFTLKK